MKIFKKKLNFLQKLKINLKHIFIIIKDEILTESLILN